MNSFFRDLRQRKVCSVAFASAGVAGLAVQSGATVTPSYHAPDWILPILLRTDPTFPKLGGEEQP
jgi:hypothetical protein